MYIHNNIEHELLSVIRSLSSSSICLLYTCSCSKYSKYSKYNKYILDIYSCNLNMHIIYVLMLFIQEERISTEIRETENKQKSFIFNSFVVVVFL